MRDCLLALEAVARTVLPPGARALPLTVLAGSSRLVSGARRSAGLAPIGKESIVARRARSHEQTLRSVACRRGCVGTHRRSGCRRSAATSKTPTCAYAMNFDKSTVGLQSLVCRRRPSRSTTARSRRSTRRWCRWPPTRSGRIYSRSSISTWRSSANSKGRLELGQDPAHRSAEAGCRGPGAKTGVRQLLVTYLNGTWPCA